MPIQRNDLTLKVGFDIDKFQTELNKTTNNLNKWGNQITGTLKGLATGFAALKLGQFAFDAAKLAAEAEGVERAFSRINNSVKLLRELKQATGGAVSELQLMRRAVQFDKFGLDLETLPKLLKFASLTAAETGQSVDYLVDSIVTGLGRKSVLILDNLGLSATRIKEEFDKTGDFVKAVGKIVDEELPKMGEMLDNNALKVANTSAAWEDFTVNIGKLVNNSGILQAALDGLNNTLKELNREPVEETVALTKEFKKLRQEAAAKGDIEAWVRYNNLVQQGADYLKKYAENKAEAAKKPEPIAQDPLAVKPRKVDIQLETFDQKIVGFDSPEIKINAEADAMMRLTSEILKNNSARMEGQAAWENYNLQLQESQQLAMSWANTISSSIGTATDAELSAAQKIVGVTRSVVGALEQQALAHIINNWTKIPNPAAALIGAAAGFAAIKGLFRKIGGSGGGGGGGGAGGIGSEASRLTPVIVQQGQRLEIGGEFKVKGPDLIASIKNQTRRDGAVKGG